MFCQIKRRVNDRWRLVQFVCDLKTIYYVLMTKQSGKRVVDFLFPFRELDIMDVTIK